MGCSVKDGGGGDGADISVEGCCDVAGGDGTDTGECVVIIICRDEGVASLRPEQSLSVVWLRCRIDGRDGSGGEANRRLWRLTLVAVVVVSAALSDCDWLDE